MKPIFIFVVVLFLTACGSVTTPDSHYYRLAELQTNNISNTVKLTTDVSVSLFKATGMLNNRNLLYAEAERPNEVVQLHYHLWHDSLPQLLTHHFIRFLKLSTENSNISKYDYTAVKGLRVMVSVEQMEIQYSSDATLFLKLNIQVENNKGIVLLNKDYENTQSYETKDIYQLVTHYNEVLLKTYSQFFEDFVALQLNM